MEKNPLYEGKAKQIFATDNPDEVLVYYKDDATAFNGEKKGTIQDKGVLNNKISTFFFEMLGKAGIPHHLVKRLSDREMLVKLLSAILPPAAWRNAWALRKAPKWLKPFWSSITRMTNWAIL